MLSLAAREKAAAFSSTEFGVNSFDRLFGGQQRRLALRDFSELATSSTASTPDLQRAQRQ